MFMAVALAAALFPAGIQPLSPTRAGSAKGETAMDTVRMSAPRSVASWPTVHDYSLTRPPGEPLSALPIRTDLREAIALGMRHLTSLFDKDKDNEPFFYANCRADGFGEMHHAVNIGIPHVVGRCLLGCLDGEEAAGIPASPEGIAILERYLRQSFDNEDHLNSYLDPARGNRRFVEFHNMREGLYGLVMLARDRHSSWAKETAGAMLRTLDAITNEKGEWSGEPAKARGMGDRCEGLSIANAARLVDPLVEYYQLTKDPLALKLAGLYARRGLETIYEPDGRFSPDMSRSSGHVHSITSALSGITRYGLLVHDRKIVDACRLILAKGVPEYFSTWGWGDEVYPAHPANVIGRGEVNQTGDVVRAALALGASGDSAGFELAERYLRSMLLPVQQREADLKRFLKDVPNPDSDARRNVLPRSVGGFGFPLPDARMREGDWPVTTLDITSGAVHALSECYRNILVRTGGESRLNLLFTSQNTDFAVTSRLPLEGRIELQWRSKKRLFIRMPPWVDRKSVALAIDGKGAETHFENDYLVVPAHAAGAKGVVTFAVPCKTEKEIVDGTEYTTTWIGSQAIAILPAGSVGPLPF